METATKTAPHSGGTALSTAFIWGVGLNTAYVVAEVSSGLKLDSMALLSDAGHNFSDVISLLLAMVGYGLSRRKPTKTWTFGLGKSTVLISLLNALLLLVAMGAVAWEGITRIINPVPLDGGLIAWVAVAGIAVNSLSAYLFFAHQKHDLNARGAFLHLAADAAVSAGVVLSGVAILFLPLPWLDGVMSILIACIVVWSTWGIFRESLRLSLDGVPLSINLDTIKSSMEAVEGVREVHHIHSWAISTSTAALTAHVVTTETTFEGAIALKNKLKHLLEHSGIAHNTLEMELEGDHCHDTSHEIKPETAIDSHHHHSHG